MAHRGGVCKQAELSPTRSKGDSISMGFYHQVYVDQRADGEFRLDQSKYINDLLNKFMPNSDAYAHSRKVPYPESLFKNLQEASSDAEIERVKQLPYLQLVGSLLYLSTMSRPDIAYYMGVLCSFMQGMLNVTETSRTQLCPGLVALCRP